MNFLGKMCFGLMAMGFAVSAVTQTPLVQYFRPEGYAAVGFLVGCLFFFQRSKPEN